MMRLHYVLHSKFKSYTFEGAYVLLTLTSYNFSSSPPIMELELTVFAINNC